MADSQDIETLRRLALAATPGPWRVRNKKVVTYGDSAVCGAPVFRAGEHRQSMANAAYIAAASPEVVLGLLEQIDELKYQITVAQQGWKCECNTDDAWRFARECDELKEQLETERMRLAACGVAALGYFDGCKDEYRSASLGDVLRMHAKLAAYESRPVVAYLVNFTGGGMLLEFKKIKYLHGAKVEHIPLYAAPKEPTE